MPPGDPAPACPISQLEPGDLAELDTVGPVRVSAAVRTPGGAWLVCAARGGVYGPFRGETSVPLLDASPYRACQAARDAQAPEHGHEPFADPSEPYDDTAVFPAVAGWDSARAPVPRVDDGKPPAELDGMRVVDRRTGDVRTLH